MPEVLAMQCGVTVDEVSERIRVVVVEPRRYAECISRQDERLSESRWQYVTCFSVRASRSSSVVRRFEQIRTRQKPVTAEEGLNESRRVTMVLRFILSIGHDSSDIVDQIRELSDSFGDQAGCTEDALASGADVEPNGHFVEQSLNRVKRWRQAY
jgi:hypothetical protein